MFRKNFLLLFGLTISISILAFGTPAYQKELNKSTTDKTAEANISIAPTVTNTDEIVAKTPPATATNSPKKTQSETPIAINSTPTTQSTSEAVETTAKLDLPTPIATTTSVVEPQKTVSLTIQGLGDYQIYWHKDDTAWDLLKRAAAQYNFAMSYQQFSFGIYIRKIGQLETHDNFYWALYYNNQYSMLGASDLKINPNDKISWQFETW